MNTKVGDFVKICRNAFPTGKNRRALLSESKFLVVGTTETGIIVRKDSPTAWIDIAPRSWTRVAAPVRRPRKDAP